MNIVQKTLFVCSIFTGITSCNFNKSVSKDFITGISTQGNGLSAEQIFVTVNNEKVSDNEFYYGQNIYINFENMDGFVVENNTYHPQMEVTLVSKAGDTIMYEPNLLSQNTGFDVSLKTLTGNMILARPIYSGEDYLLKYVITDKNGAGTFSSSLKFDIVPDPAIKIAKKGLDFKEGYLLSLTKNAVINDGKVDFEEVILMDFQDVSGYTMVNGLVELGLKIRVTDANDTVILNMEDVFGEQYTSEAEIKRGVGAQLKLNKGELKNPINFQVTIWDKNSDARLDAETELIVE
ncbi:hypothetical protein [Cellulophaga sp. Z1A5H]|uniref:hypothetical protein n=1 Tax=Cellulophaga sp. Z1A5H TaxID=2687291 RepID=UPI0013FD4394|nr:hypothetical protein [Cellulophaga sp. Z1A5H]